MKSAQELPISLSETVFTLKNREKKITGKRVTQILAENKLAGEVPEDIQFLLKRAIIAKKHLDKNKKDMVTKRGLHLMESKIRRLAKYYKSEGRLPGNWKYELIG